MRSATSKHLTQEDYDMASEINFKLVLVGDAAVGKSQLALRFCKNTFNSNPKATIGVEMMKKVLKIDTYDNTSTQYVGAHIWDTAGQERYKALSSLYFKGAVGALLVFDLTSNESFENVQDWLKLIRDKADPNVVIILIGNKSDLVERR